MGDVILDEHFARLTDAKAALTAAAEEHSAASLAYRIEQEHEADAAFDGDVYRIDADIARAGITAAHEIEVAASVVSQTHATFVNAFAAAIEGGRLTVGVTVPTPYSPGPMTVVDVYDPTGDPVLSEVTLSADGGPVLRDAHVWPIDGEFRPVVDPDVASVRFERWGASGLRVAGHVHAVSRRFLDVDG